MSIILFLNLFGVLILTSSTPKLRPLEALLKAEMDEICLKHNIPGMTAAFVLKDGTVGAVATGIADKEYNIPMTPESRMLAASIGKTFVAATCVALAKEGVLNLDRPIADWLGKFHWFERLPNHDKITLRQLLNHTSGLPDHVYDQRFANAFIEKKNSLTNPFSPESLIEYILDTKPINEPGKKWSYSDTGYLLVGLIIERSTGKNFYEEVIQRFIDPLELRYTSPSDTINLPGLATGYLAPENDFGLPIKTTRSPGLMVWHPGIEWAGGGFISNSQDLAKWFKVLFSSSSDFHHLGKEMVNSVPMNSNNSRISSGLGVFIQDDSPLGITYGHSGWIPGYRSNVQYYAEYDFALAFQINTDYGFEGDPIKVFDEIKWRLAKIVVQ